MASSNPRSSRGGPPGKGAKDSGGGRSKGSAGKGARGSGGGRSKGSAGKGARGSGGERSKGSGGKGARGSGGKGSRPPASDKQQGSAKRGAPGYRQRSADAAKRSGAAGVGGPSTTKSGPSSTKKRRQTPSGRNVPDEPIPGNRSWGGLARKGALRAAHDDVRSYDRDDGAAGGTAPLDDEERERRAERERRQVEREKRTAALRAEARTAVERAERDRIAQPRRAPKPKPARDRAPLGRGRSPEEDEVTALNRLLGPQEAKKQLRKLRTAADSFEAERYADAAKSLKAIAELAPGVPEVRELYGLTLYRMGRFTDAARELEAFRELAASADQNPVLADCYRAQERWADVEALWRELADVSPAADLVNEGRIVMAGALADQDDLGGAVRVLEKGWKRPNKPQVHHLRRAYALADLYERSGDLPRARALFDWVVSNDRDFVDARRRLRNLR